MHIMHENIKIYYLTGNILNKKKVAEGLKQQKYKREKKKEPPTTRKDNKAKKNAVKKIRRFNWFEIKLFTVV